MNKARLATLAGVGASHRPLVHVHAKHTKSWEHDKDKKVLLEEKVGVRVDNEIFLWSCPPTMRN